jgi:sec-independent protein translocase protein TatA
MPHFIGPTELILVVVLALIIFGPGKLPEVGKAIGRTIKEFRRSSREAIDDNTGTSAEINQEGQQVIKATKS